MANIAIPLAAANGFISAVTQPQPQSGSTKIPKNPNAQYRPKQWNQPAMVMVTSPTGSVQSSEATNALQGDITGSAASLQGSATGTVALPVSYVFDAVLSLEHDQALTKTRHPVQTGAAISSHAYIEPAVLVLYILMSDVTPQYAAKAQTQDPYIQPWTGNASKSVSAYQQMIALQAARVPLTVTTRLRTYNNMLIDRIAPREDEKTITGARFRIEFGQIILANILPAAVSARENDTGSTGLGAVNPVTPSATTQQQFGVPLQGEISTSGGSVPTPPLGGSIGTTPTAEGDIGVLPINVPGASNYSSTPQQYGPGVGGTIGKL